MEYFNQELGDTAFFRAHAESLINSNGWDATMVAPASGIYNCHAYAWYVSEGGSECWITATDYGIIDFYNHSITPTDVPSNLNEYWTNNGGYHNISSKAVKAKVYYGSQWSWDNIYMQWINLKDHSAIVNDDMNYFISKWGKLPRYRHQVADCPYVSTSLSYYALNNPVINGSSGVLCNNTQRTFNSDFTTSNWSYDWNVWGYLNQVSGDGTPNYTVGGTSSIGYGTLYLTVTSPSGLTASTQKNIGVNVPLQSEMYLDLYTSGGTKVSFLCPNTTYHIYLMNNDGSCSLSNYSWSIPSAWNLYYQYQNMISINTNSSPGARIVVNANTCCVNNATVFTGYVGGGYCGSSFALSVFPNPTTGSETTLSIEPASEAVVFDENAEWEVEIFDQMQVLKKQKTKLKGKEFKIQTTGWRVGIYIIGVKYKDEYLQTKLIVN